MSTTAFLVVAALLLTGLAATPADAHNFFRLPGRRYRGHGWWQRRYSPPATPTPPAQRQCTCAPSPPTTTGTGGGAARPAAAEVPDPLDCVTPLSPMMSCGWYLTPGGSGGDAPAPGSDCCAGLAGFVDGAAAPGGGGDSQLKCLCPILTGYVNTLLQTPVDPVRMIFLPSACGVVIPPQVIPLCLNASSRWMTSTTP